jgi:hypothetical protein
MTHGIGNPGLGLGQTKNNELFVLSLLDVGSENFTCQSGFIYVICTITLNDAICGIVDHHCLEVIACFVDIGGIVDHHCLEVIVCFVDIGGIVDHHCLEVIVCFVDIGVMTCTI